jgi:hypothetical protein
MFKLDFLANFPGREFSLLVPVFSAINQGNENTPYVQIMDQDFNVTSIVPYYLLEDARSERVSSDITIDIGSRGIIGFLLQQDDLVFGDIDFIRTWVRKNGAMLQAHPLLEAQLIRMTKASYGEKYNILAKSASALFKGSRSEKLWLSGEILLLQKNSQIWDSIARVERVEKTGSEWLNPISEPLSVDKERLVQWLSNVNNFENPYWSKVWFYAEELVGGISADERLFAIGTRWLQYLVGSGGGYIIRAASLLNRILQFSRRHTPSITFPADVSLKALEANLHKRRRARRLEIEVDEFLPEGDRPAIESGNSDLKELLLEIFEDGTIFNREIGVTEPNIEIAFSEATSSLSDDETIALLVKILTRYNLYEGELVFFARSLAALVLKFLEDFDSDKALRLVSAFDASFFNSKNAKRFFDNSEVRTAWKFILTARDAIADRFDLGPLKKELLDPTWRSVVRPRRVKKKKSRSGNTARHKGVSV